MLSFTKWIYQDFLASSTEADLEHNVICVSSSATGINEKVCLDIANFTGSFILLASQILNQIIKVYGCIQKGLDWQSSSMGKPEAQGSQDPSRLHSRGVGTGKYI